MNLHLHQITSGLARDPDGYWVAPEAITTSYPIGGNEFCLMVEERSFWFPHRGRAIVAAARRFPPAGGPIFDVGAGNGYVAAALEESGFETVAIEPNRAGAANAAARGLANVICGVLPSLSIHFETAGAIGLFDVIEHIEHDQEFLESVQPYLHRGGRLYITTPAYQWLWSTNDVYSGHYRRYTVSQLRELVVAAGYRVEYATYFFSILPPAICLFRTLPSRFGRSGELAMRSRSQHAAGGTLVRRTAERCLRFEIRRIERAATIPFGGSCLIVATRTD